MILTKKSIIKIALIVAAYWVLGGGCIALGLLFRSIGFVGDRALLWLGGIALGVGVLLIFWGRYAEGEGILVNSGNRWIRKELKPAEFIRQYENLQSSGSLVVNRPGVYVCYLLVLAYDCLNEKEKTMAAADAMIAVAGKKKKAFASLIKVSILFSEGETEEAEALFAEVQKQKLNFLCRTLVDSIVKSDRAMAMGDYKLVEAYNLGLLSRSFPKLDPLGTVLVHYRLGEIYEKLEDKEKALPYYRYCVENGGELALRMAAAEAIERLQ